MIYFIQCRTTKAIKIGYTVGDPKGRLKALQTASPGKLELLGCHAGKPEDEAELHERFRHFRLRKAGEWFSHAAELREYIALNTGMPAPDGSILTFSDLAEIEPELRKIYDTAKSAANPGRPFCANAVWYGYYGYENRGLKKRVEYLAGWHARDQRMRSMRVYDIAYETCYDVLPSCEDFCACQNVMAACLGVSG